MMEAMGAAEATGERKVSWTQNSMKGKKKGENLLDCLIQKGQKNPEDNTRHIWNIRSQHTTPHPSTLAETSLLGRFSLHLQSNFFGGGGKQKEARSRPALTL